MISARISVSPGDGVVVRRGELVAAMPEVTGVDDDAVASFVAAIGRAAADPDPVTSAANALGEHAGPGAVVISIADPLTVLVLGDADVHASSPGSELHLHGRNADGPVIRRISDPVETIIVGNGGAANQPWLDLADGVVPGGGVAVRVHSVETGAVPVPDDAVLAEDPSVPPEVPSPPPDSPEFDSISFIGIDLDDVGSRALPIEAPIVSGSDTPEATTSVPVGDDDVAVQGLRCRHGHFNHPQAANCAWCGLSMVQDSYILVDGPRPPLGVLVVNETATYTVDKPYVLGRKPSLDPKVQSGDAHPLPLQDPDRHIGRVHAEVVLDGWEVKILHRHSNPTWLLKPGATEWERVPPDEPTVVPPAGSLQIGPHRISFHSHHIR